MLKNTSYLLALVPFLFLLLFCGVWLRNASAREVQPLIESLEVGDPLYYENLTIIPVYNAEQRMGADYATLDEALDRGWLDIEEIGHGNVPRIRVRNTSFRPVFIMGGEIISGGKQDRIVERDVLLGARSQYVTVPVYCTEQGRWDGSTRFYSKKNLGTWSMRATAQYAPSNAQHEIWGDISSSSRDMGVSSRTSAYQSVYEDTTVQQKIYRHEQYFQDIPRLAHDTVGVIVAVDGEIVSVDLFSSNSLFRQLWPKILKASALAAVSRGRYGSADQGEAVRFLRQIHDAPFRSRFAVALGTELTAYGHGVNANALVFRQEVVHLSAFPIHGGWTRQRTYEPGYERQTRQRTYERDYYRQSVTPIQFK